MKPIREILIEGRVAIIPLTGGLSAVVDADDLPCVSGWIWHSKRRLNAAGGLASCYARRKAGAGFVYMHHAILPLQDGTEVDHIDGDGLNNRRSNLRYATKAQNQHNSRLQCNNTSGSKGVSWNKAARRWRAFICIHGRQVHLGLFHEKSAAAAAYAEASMRLHGEFGRAE